MKFFEFGPVIQMSKDFLSRALASGGPHVWWSKTIYAILEEGVIGNIHIKLFLFWTSGSDVI